MLSDLPAERPPCRVRRQDRKPEGYCMYEDSVIREKLPKLTYCMYVPSGNDCTVPRPCDNGLTAGIDVEPLPKSYNANFTCEEGKLKLSYAMLRRTSSACSTRVVLRHVDAHAARNRWDTLPIERPGMLLALHSTKTTLHTRNKAHQICVLPAGFFKQNARARTCFFV